MPYQIKKKTETGEFCTHKKNPDGSMGKEISCFKDKKSALDHMRALYANEEKSVILDDLIDLFNNPETAMKCMGMNEMMYVPYNVTSLADAAAAQDAEMHVKEMKNLVGMFQQVVSNILYSPDVSDKKAALNDVVGELSGMLEDHSDEIGDAAPDDEMKAKRAGSPKASDYLVVEDAKKPTTWHLPVKENGKPNHRLMGAAFAALASSGGHRGKKYAGPSAGAALAKLKRLYKQEGLELPSSKSLDEFGFDYEFTPFKADQMTGMASMMEDGKKTESHRHKVMGETTDMRSGHKHKIKDGKVQMSMGHAHSIPEDALPTADEGQPKSVDRTTIKSISDSRVGSYAVLWGNEDQKDLTKEFFDPDTEELTVIFDGMGRLPYLYNHTLNDVMKSTVIGIVDTLVTDSVGLWYEAELKIANEYESAIKKLLKDGKLKTSTQTFYPARRVAKNGRIERWPIVEISATPTPAEARMISVEVVKSAFTQIGCDNFWTVAKEAGLVESIEGDDQGVEKARLYATLENERAFLETLI